MVEKAMAEVKNEGERGKVARARYLLGAIPYIRKAVDDYLDDLIVSATFSIVRHSKTMPAMLNALNRSREEMKT
jgi:hypothetical protein